MPAAAVDNSAFRKAVLISIVLSSLFFLFAFFSIGVWLNDVRGSSLINVSCALFLDGLVVDVNNEYAPKMAIINTMATINLF